MTIDVATMINMLKQHHFEIAKSRLAISGNYFAASLLAAV